MSSYMRKSKKTTLDSFDEATYVSIGYNRSRRFDLPNVIDIFNIFELLWTNLFNFVPFYLTCIVQQATSESPMELESSVSELDLDSEQQESHYQQQPLLHSETPFDSSMNIDSSNQNVIVDDNFSFPNLSVEQE